MHQVSITAGPKPPTDYHGAVDFVSCLSSIGLPVQARKGLMKIRGRRSIDGGPEDGGSCSSENTRGDISGSEIGGGCRRDSAEVVTVNITTTFVPHMVSEGGAFVCVRKRVLTQNEQADRRCNIQQSLQ